MDIGKFFKEISHEKLTIAVIFLFLLFLESSAISGIVKETIPTDKPFNHSPSIIELPNHKLMVAWYSGSKEKNMDTSILFSLKRNRWTSPEILVDTPDKSDGNPVIFILGTEIYCLYSVLWGRGWSTARLFYVKSKISSHFQWGNPERILPFYSTGDLCRGKPFIINKNSFLLPLYKELFGYSSYVCMIKNDKVIWHSHPLKSRYGNLQPVLVPSKKSLLMFMRSPEDGCILESISTDNGKTWKKPIKRKDLPQPNSGFDAIRLSSGKIVIVFNDNSKNTHSLVISSSDDNGKTFKHKRILENDKNRKFLYPSIIQDSKGKIHIVYSVDKKEIRHIRISY